MRHELPSAEGVRVTHAVGVLVSFNCQHSLESLRIFRRNYLDLEDPRACVLVTISITVMKHHGQKQTRQEGFLSFRFLYKTSSSKVVRVGDLTGQGPRGRSQRRSCGGSAVY